MNAPNLFSAESLKNWECSVKTPDGNWIPARPMGLIGLHLVHRLKLGWMVFSGRADAVVWKVFPETLQSPQPMETAGREVRTKYRMIHGVPFEAGDMAVRCDNPGVFIPVHPRMIGKMANDPAYSFFRLIPENVKGDAAAGWTLVQQGGFSPSHPPACSALCPAAVQHLVGAIREVSDVGTHGSVEFHRTFMGLEFLR